MIKKAFISLCLVILILFFLNSCVKVTNENSKKTMSTIPVTSIKTTIPTPIETFLTTNTNTSTNLPTSINKPVIIVRPTIKELIIPKPSMQMNTITPKPITPKPIIPKTITPKTTTSKPMLNISGTYLMWNSENPIDGNRIIVISHIGKNKYNVEHLPGPNCWPWKGELTLNDNEIIGHGIFETDTKPNMRVEGIIKNNNSIDVKYIFFNPKGRIDYWIWKPR